MAVVVEVGEAGTPAPAATAGAGESGDIVEAAVAAVAVEAVAALAPGDAEQGRGEVEIGGSGVVNAGDKPVEVAVVVVVTHRTAHAVFIADSGIGGAQQVAVALVQIYLAGLEVGGHQHVGPAVVVDIGEVGSEVIHEVVSDTGTATDVGEAAVAVVAEQVFLLGIGCPVGNPEIEIAVFVIVGKAGAHGLADEWNAGAAGDIGEGAVFVVVEQARLFAGIDAGYQQIKPAVAVVISKGGAAVFLTSDGHASVGCHINEAAIAEIAVQQIGADRAAGNVQVNPAVVVKITSGDTRRHQLAITAYAIGNLLETMGVIEAGSFADFNEVPLRGLHADAGCAVEHAAIVDAGLEMQGVIANAQPRQSHQRKIAER